MDKKLLYDVFNSSEEEIRHKFGLPTQLVYMDGLQELYLVSRNKFREYIRDRSPDSDKMAMTWSKILLECGDRYEKFRSKDLSSFGKELQLSFEFVENEFPTMDELVNK